MSKLSAFIKDIKKAEAKPKEEPKKYVKREAKPKLQPKEEVKVEVKPKEAKPVYVARRPHAKTRERNELFKEFVKSDEAKELIKDVKNTQKLKVLVNAFKEKFSELMPLVSAYSIYNQIQNEQN